VRVAAYDERDHGAHRTAHWSHRRRRGVRGPSGRRARRVRASCPSGGTGHGQDHRRDVVVPPCRCRRDPRCLTTAGGATVSLRRTWSLWRLRLAARRPGRPAHPEGLAHRRAAAAVGRHRPRGHGRRGTGSTYRTGLANPRPLRRRPGRAARPASASFARYRAHRPLLDRHHPRWCRPRPRDCDGQEQPRSTCERQPTVHGSSRSALDGSGSGPCLVSSPASSSTVERVANQTSCTSRCSTARIG
jgi:hypothetical protein